MKLSRNLRIITLLLLTAFCLPMFLACGEDTGGTGDSTTTTAAGGDVDSSTTTEAPVETDPPETDPPTTTEAPTTTEPTEPPTDPAERPEPDENGVIAGFRYYLRSPNSDLYLTVDKESKYTGFTQDEFTGAPNQMFVFEPLESGDYKIWAVGTTKRYLDTEDAVNDNGILLMATETPYGEGSHDWKLVKQSDGAISLMSKISDYKRCVDVEGVSKDAGHQIHLWEGGTSANQKWYFELVADGISPMQGTP